MRSEKLEGQEKSLVTVGIELAPAGNFSVTLAQEAFTKHSETISTSLESLAARQKPPSAVEIKSCKCKFGELRILATLSRPGIFVRLARIASRVNSSQWSDVFESTN